MSNSPNKNYNLQATSSNVNTWGIIANGNFSLIDANLGGTLTIDVSGSANITLTADQAKNLIQNLTGTLTGNINYVFPAKGGFYAIHNKATGNFTITVNVAGGTGAGIVVTQGTTATIYIDSTVPDIYGLSGTQSVYTAISVGGTANALTIPVTLPGGFSLVPGLLITFTPTAFNTVAGPTVNIAGTGALISKQISPAGLTDLPIGSFAPGSPIIAYYNGTVLVILNHVYTGMVISKSTNFSVDVLALWNTYYSTTPLAITVSATSGLPPFWWIELNALGGAITITPNAADSINGGAAGASVTIPQGASGKLETDAAGKLILNFCATNISNAQLSLMNPGTIKSNITGGLAAPVDNTLSAILDTITNTQGSILFRGAGIWQALGPGIAGQILEAQGPAANPAWIDSLGLAKFWIRFNGTGPTIAGSYNVASVTRSSAGQYRVTFTVPFSSLGNALVGSTDIAAGRITLSSGQAFVDIGAYDSSGAFADASSVFIVGFGVQ